MIDDQFDALLDWGKKHTVAELTLRTVSVCRALEETASSRTASPADREDARRLLQLVKGLRFWLTERGHPAGLSESDFGRLEPLCKHYIETGEMESEDAKVFCRRI